MPDDLATATTTTTTPEVIAAPPEDLGTLNVVAHDDPEKKPGPTLRVRVGSKGKFSAMATKREIEQRLADDIMAEMQGSDDGHEQGKGRKASDAVVVQRVPAVKRVKEDAGEPNGAEAAVVADGAPTTEAPPAEGGAEGDAPNTEPTPKASSQLAIIARQVAKARRIERDIKAQQQALESQKQAFAAQQAEVQKQLEASRATLEQVTQAREKARLNPRAFVEAHGLQLDDVARGFLPGSEPKPEDKVTFLEQRLEKMAAMLEERGKAEETARVKAAEEAVAKATEAQQQAARAHYHAQIDDVLKKGGDGFELLAIETADDPSYAHTEIMGVLGYVFENGGTATIDGKTFRFRPGTELPLDTAAKIVEDHLVQRAQRRANAKKLRPADAAGSREDAPTRGSTESQAAPAASRKPAAPTVATREPFDRRTFDRKALNEAARLLSPPRKK